ncbi:MAG: replication protein [Bacillota bacterium]
MPKGDREKLKADIEDGTTPMAHLLLEALAMAKLNGTQKGLILFLARRTYGWTKDRDTKEKFKEDTITLSEWADACDIDEPYASRMIRDLIKMRVIVQKGGGNGKAGTYSLNTKVDDWDEGCINIQGLYERTKVGLYIHTKVRLYKYTKVNDRRTHVAQGLKGGGKKGLNKDERKVGLKEMPKFQMPPIPEDRKEYWERYTADQQRQIEEYWDVLRFTRKNGKISDGIILRQLEPAVVIQALKIHIERYSDLRDERYTEGIMRNLRNDLARGKDKSPQTAGSKKKLSPEERKNKFKDIYMS